MLLDDLTEEYNKVRQLGVIAQLEWLGTRMDIENTEFGRAYEIQLSRQMKPWYVTWHIKANEYATLILRNNDVLDRPLFTLDNTHALLDDMFRKRPRVWQDDFLG